MSDEKAETPTKVEQPKELTPRFSSGDLEILYGILTSDVKDIEEEELKWLLKKHNYIVDKLSLKVHQYSRDDLISKMFKSNPAISRFIVTSSFNIVVAKTSRYICIMSIGDSGGYSVKYSLNVYPVKELASTPKPEELPDEIKKDKTVMEGYKLVVNDRSGKGPDQVSKTMTYLNALKDSIKEEDFAYINSIDELDNIYLQVINNSKSYLVKTKAAKETLVEDCKRVLDPAVAESNRIALLERKMEDPFFTKHCNTLALPQTVAAIGVKQTYKNVIKAAKKLLPESLLKTCTGLLDTINNDREACYIMGMDFTQGGKKKITFWGRHVLKYYNVARSDSKDFITVGEKQIVYKGANISIRYFLSNNKLYIFTQQGNIYNYIDTNRHFYAGIDGAIILAENHEAYSDILSIAQKGALHGWETNDRTGRITARYGNVLVSYLTNEYIKQYIRFTRPQIKVVKEASSANDLKRSFFRSLNRMAETGKPFDFYPRFGGVPLKITPEQIEYNGQVIKATGIPVTIPYSVVASIYDKIDKKLVTSYGLDKQKIGTIDDCFTGFGFTKALSYIPLFWPSRLKCGYGAEFAHDNDMIKLLAGFKTGLTIDNANLISGNCLTSGTNYSREIQLSTMQDFDFNNLKSLFIDRVGILLGLVEKIKELKDDPLNGVLTTVTIGNVNAEITYTIFSQQSVRFKVNGYNIRRDEITEVLNNALCFNTQKDYDDYIKMVSQISIKARKLLQDGLKLTVQVGASTARVVLEPDRDRAGHWYLLIRDDKNKVIKKCEIAGGISKFVTIFSSRDYEATIKSSGSYSLGLSSFVALINQVKDFELKDLKQMLSVGFTLINLKLARSRKLLEDVVKLTKAEYKTDKQASGYVIKGMSGQKYMITCDHQLTDKEANKPYFDNHGTIKMGQVLTYPNMQYICIVDKSIDQAGYDQVASRLLALTSDTFIVRDVHTLSGIVGNQR